MTYLTLNNITTLKSGLEVTQGHSNWYHSKAWVRFPISAFHSNYGSILHQFRDIARYWSQIVIYLYSLAFGAVPRRNISTPFGMENLEWLGYAMVNKIRKYLYLFSRNSRKWRTDRHTDTAHMPTCIGRTYASHRAVKMCGQVHCLHSLLPPSTNYSFKHRPRGHPFELPRYSYDLSRKSLVFIARQHTDARYWYSKSVRPSVRPLRSDIRWKRLNISS